MTQYYVVYSDYSGNINFFTPHLDSETCGDIKEELTSFPFIDIVIYVERLSNSSHYVDGITAMKERYDVVGAGQNRIVFKLDEDYVVKVPFHPLGAEQNHVEANMALSAPFPTAACEIITVHGVECLKMEYVSHWSNHFYSSGELDNWCMLIDNVQVGYTKAGQLVAYDFAQE